MSRPRSGLRGLALLALSALACGKPAPIDPAEEAYHEAVLRFAEVSKLTQDLTYRDHRFDPVLDALDQIPAGSDPKSRALALAERIRAARTLASSQQRTTDLLQAQAEAPPSFEPQARLLPGAPLQLAKPPETPVVLEDPGSPESVGGGGGAVPRDPVKKLPSWYGNYFGAAEKVEDGGATQADATPVAGQDAPARRRPAPSAEDAAPPPVFGLPGPARGALQGKPGNE